jgi:hypothetical protein
MRALMRSKRVYPLNSAAKRRDGGTIEAAAPTNEPR